MFQNDAIFAANEKLSTMANEYLGTPVHLDVTLEDNAMVSDIKKALMLIKGVASIQITYAPNANVISKALAKKIDKARADFAKGQYTECKSAEELYAFLESLWR